MVAMRSPKAAIAHSMKMRDLINSNSADHSLRRQSSGWGLAASMPSRQSIIQTTRPPRGSVVFTNRNRPGVRLGRPQQGTSTRSNRVWRCTGVPKRRLAGDSYRRLVGSLSVQPRRRFSSVSQPSSRAFSVAAALAMRVNSWEVTRALRSSWPKPLRKHRPRGIKPNLVS